MQNNKKLREQLELLLFADTEKFWLNLEQRKYRTLLDKLCSWKLLHNKPDHEEEIPWLMLQTISFLFHEIEQITDTIKQLNVKHFRFLQQIEKSEIDAEKHLHILSYAEELGASAEQLKADQAAFDRWFDEAAVVSRYHNQVAEHEQLLGFLILRLGALGNLYLLEHSEQPSEAWQRLDLQTVCSKLLQETDNEQIKSNIIKTLVGQIATLYAFGTDPELNKDLVNDLVAMIEDNQAPYQAVVGIMEILIHQRPTFIRAHVWSIIEDSLDMGTLKPIAPNTLYILSQLPRIITRQQSLTERDESLLLALSQHNLPRARQAVIEQLSSYPDRLAEQILLARFSAEQSDAVRITLLKQLTDMRFSESDFAFTLWQKTLNGQYSLPVKRLALELSARIMLNMQAHEEQPSKVFKRFIDTLNAQLKLQSHIALNRYITRTREQLSSFYHQAIIAALDNQTDQVSIPLCSDDVLGRVLSFKGQNAVGFNATKRSKGWSVLQGYRKGIRLWKVLYEYMHPSTDKRHSYPHSQAKKPAPYLHVPSCTTAEISETKVPGELLYNTQEHSSRPHLPLLDFLLSALSHDCVKKPAKTYTPDGILVVQAPSALWRRLKAYWSLSLDYKRFDDLRKGSDIEQQHYLHQLAELGFQLKFVPYASIDDCAFPVSEDISTLYNRSELSTTFLSLWYSFREYMDSAYQNTIGQLVFFVLAFISYFWGRHIYISRKIIDNRSHIPVTIGGWGTRGKSGTERLKSALFSSLSMRVISKTTGCEAMLIYSKPSGEQYEVPIFRPFDKASIWEQADVLEFARKVKADVFLWECMGLTPRYVKVLVRWMKDNFTTITNAYPDHEDILGPSGMDVANEMCAFIGKKTQVFSAEQNMAPVLDLYARKVETSLIRTHWADSLQITPDVLAQYPYNEHPDNIALVCKMAAYIGINKDYVYKETAARIIPDIGVLQHFQAAKVDQVSQSFINGMSANERLATLENWRRLELELHAKKPKNQLIALINNRNDRVARSQVFASIMVNDVPFDKLVVIGTNIDGFYNYTKQALHEKLNKIIDNEDIDSLHALIHRWRLDYSIEQLTEQATLAGAELHCPPDATFVQLREALAAAHSLSEQDRQHLITHSDTAEKALQFLELTSLQPHRKDITTAFENWFIHKCLLVSDSAINPNKLTSQIAKFATSGQHQFIVGMQNIKGPGLSYVYMWQHWQQVYRLIEKLKSAQCSQTEFTQGLSWLMQQDNLHLFESLFLKQVLNELLVLPHAQNSLSQVLLSQLSEKLTEQAELDPETNTNKPNGLRQFAINIAESFLSAGAAVRRKNQATQIYQDIADQRITIERAITLLSALNRNQKNGWLDVEKDQK
ncbi:poly-gamma-glutamate synthase PgsB [Pseudoalteromonas sp. T1lg65]|uniref:poly-gamma-glutamate synthase PgsB n=1 Tax=Pseudoalteromonas sp. T1lg65 TaxID=2077101 RepID=UPI003F7AFC64